MSGEETMIDRGMERDSNGLTDEERRMWALEGFDDLPAFLSVPAAAKVLGVSRSTGYACVSDGTLRAIKIRKRLVIPRCELFTILFQFRTSPLSA